MLNNSSNCGHPGLVTLYWCCCSVAKLCLTLRSYGLQHPSLPCPSLSPSLFKLMSIVLVMPSNHNILCWPLLILLCPQSFPASGSFPMIQFFASGGQRIGASASVLPMNIQNWFPLGLTGLISLQSKGL